MAGIICVGCGGTNLRVVDSRANANNCVVRRRQCKDCGAKFTTAEEPVALAIQGVGTITRSEAASQEAREAATEFVSAFVRLLGIAGIDLIAKPEARG